MDFQQDSIVTNLAEVPFLQDLGYDFNIKGWPDVVTLLVKAQQDLPPLARLARDMDQRIIDLKRSEIECGERHFSELFIEELVQVFRKARTCVTWLALVSRKVYQQVSMALANPTTASEYEIESLFVPGQRVVFKHSPEEMIEYLTSFCELFAKINKLAQDLDLKELGRCERMP
ncbi:MAG: hypothetical protein LQ344_003617 [Seirophora lacunosa]|nr:MAG: hypothetical protein LQ344_003617 [Seirophora lacunosa]